MSALRELWRRGQRGWPARFPLAQFPNAPLAAALAGSLVSGATDGRAHAYARAVFFAGFAIWAWEEASAGVNWFRRALGVGALAYVVVRLAKALGA